MTYASLIPPKGQFNYYKAFQLFMKSIAAIRAMWKAKELGEKQSSSESQSTVIIAYSNYYSELITCEAGFING